MIVRRFLGKNAEEAIALAKLELGQDAIIISSGPRRDQWWKVWESGYQVLVAADYQPTASPSNYVAAAAPVAPASAAPSELPEWPMEMLGLLKSMDERLRKIEGVDPDTAPLLDQFLAKGLPETWAGTLADAAPSDVSDVTSYLASCVAERLGPPKLLTARDPVVALFVGPTGSGKTTTIAKLAAHFRLTQKKDVLLVTTDTFRAAATEQLKQFGTLMGVPVRVAMSPAELAQAIKERGGYEIVLVDTAGHSPEHALHMAEVQAWIQAADPTHLYVAMPATMQPKAILHAARVMAGKHPAALLFTKVDEVPTLGPALGAALDLGWPLSYLTDGQAVPEDIGTALPQTVAERVMGGSDYGAAK